jgi:hypothetical protein
MIKDEEGSKTLNGVTITKAGIVFRDPWNPPR